MHAMPLVDWSWGQSYFNPTMGSAAVTFADPGPSASNADDYAMTESPRSHSQTPAPDDDQASASWLNRGYGYIGAFRTDANSSNLSGGMAGDISNNRIPSNSIEIPKVASVQSQPTLHMPRPSSLSAGRKRSCAEISDDDSSPRTASSYSDLSSSPAKNALSMGADVAMDGSPASFADELAARLQSSTFAGTLTRPDSGDSRKSMRFDPNSPESPPASSMLDAEPAYIPRRGSPSLDGASVALGIAWSTIPSNETMDAASRGWAKYVESSYPLKNAKFIWKNNALPAFLVEAIVGGTSAYFLFNDELSEGRMIAKSWERALDNLRSRNFDGDEVMVASSVPAGAGAVESGDAMMVMDTGLKSMEKGIAIQEVTMMETD